MRIALLALLFICSNAVFAEDGYPVSDDDLLRVVQLSLDCVKQATPHEENHMSVAAHRKLHPVFWGCYDWHASVFNHWAILRVLNYSPEISGNTRMVKLLDKQFNHEDLQVEMTNLTAEPKIIHYELGWFLKLAEEIRRSEIPAAKRWRKEFEPLEKKAVIMFRDYLADAEKATDGTHYNTAFSLIHALDYAETAGEHGLRREVRKVARGFYGAHKECVPEPNPGFISNCFTIASLMSRILPKKEYQSWYRAFLPDLAAAVAENPHTSIDWLSVPPPGFGYSHHAVGLMFQQSIAMMDCADLLSDERDTYPLYRAVNGNVFHGKLILSGVVEEYGYDAGHWLGPFAIYAFTRLPKAAWAGRFMSSVRM